MLLWPLNASMRCTYGQRSSIDLRGFAAGKKLNQSHGSPSYLRVTTKLPTNGAWLKVKRESRKYFQVGRGKRLVEMGHTFNCLIYFSLLHNSHIQTHTRPLKWIKYILDNSRVQALINKDTMFYGKVLGLVQYELSVLEIQTGLLLAQRPVGTIFTIWVRNAASNLLLWITKKRTTISAGFVLVSRSWDNVFVIAFMQPPREYIEVTALVARAPAIPAVPFRPSPAVAPPASCILAPTDQHGDGAEDEEEGEEPHFPGACLWSNKLPRLLSIEKRLCHHAKKLKSKDVPK